jgi:hypothetical protein
MVCQIVFVLNSPKIGAEVHKSCDKTALVHKYLLAPLMGLIGIFMGFFLHFASKIGSN